MDQYYITTESLVWSRLSVTLSKLDVLQTNLETSGRGELVYLVLRLRIPFQVSRYEHVGYRTAEDDLGETSCKDLISGTQWSGTTA